jgi:Uma2 family endonuclease
MKVALKLGPADHGRRMSLEDFMAADAEAGYQYELIDGKLYVSPQPNLPQNVVEEWLSQKLTIYVHENPSVVNYLSHKARVFVPDREDVTNPEPDLALYKNFPKHRPPSQLRWQEVTPILVIEILSIDDPDKDLVRNVELYFQVPSIKEYWVIDTREDPERPTMLVHRRYGGRWRIIEVAGSDTYTTKLLPGFELMLDWRSDEAEGK